MPQTVQVISPYGAIPQYAVAFGTLGGAATGIDRSNALPIESGEPGAIGAVIAATTAISGAVDLDRQRLHRIVLPAEWTVAALSFQTSVDGTAFTDLYDATGEITLPSSIARAGRAVLVDPSAFYGVRWVRVRSGTAAAPVAQDAERALVLATVAR